MKNVPFKFLGLLLLTLFLFLFGYSCSSYRNRHNAAGVDTTGIDQEKFSDHVRTTEFQTPEQERAGFILPDGFEITLFASEPDITKPINMEFDERGRLWVTQSSEYPMAAAPAKASDKITILEDTNGDGKADKFTNFAENLNIPIGITTIQGEAIAYSIPNIYRFTDTNKDGKADDKKVILGEFGHKDTHGMVSNLIRGFDGWIHACHGFTNSSTIAGTDGDSITMVSGNTFRFKPDGSRVEQTTFGRVNPFGYAFDEWGYLYSVDCHTKPIYQLIKGGEYPHFGKKAPAIGFAPEMMSYELGSTALSGLVYYTGQQFPEEYQNSFYTGDVVTCRINRNTITFNGASPEAKREEDFLISKDPWFRPVDIKTGPDGSIYVADFYNRIIGHYEVPLNHPGRDRQSGRIWKISYTGNKGKKKAVARNWSAASLNELIKGLSVPQLSTRLLIANQITDNWKDKAVAPVTAMMQSPQVQNTAFIQGMWILYRLNALPDDLLSKALQHKDAIVQVHALRVLAEMKSIAPQQRTAAINGLKYTNPHVQRMSTELLAKFPHADNIGPMLAMHLSAAEKDTHLKYTSIISLRDNMRNKAVMAQVAAQKWGDGQLQILTKAVLDVPSEEGAAFSLNYIRNHQVPQKELVAQLEHISRFVPASRLGQVSDLIQKGFPGDYDTQYIFYSTIRQGVAQRGIEVTAELKEWGISMAKYFMKEGFKPVTWRNRPLGQNTDAVNPWSVIDRPVIKDLPHVKMIWSEYKWYEPTGILYSEPFKLPPTLQMNIFDNDVHNTEAKTGTSKNVVRIRLAGNNKIVAEYRPTFDKTMAVEELMQKATFNLGTNKGQNGYIEVTDSSKTSSVGMGMIEPAVVTIPDKGPAELAEQQVRTAEIAADYQVASLEPALKKLLASKTADQHSRGAAANALMTISPVRNTALISDVFKEEDEPVALRKKLAAALGQSQSAGAYRTMAAALSSAVPDLQLSIAMVLADSGKGIDMLLSAVKKGDTDADILLGIPVKERLAANMQDSQRKQLEQLTAGKAEENEERQKIIDARLANFNPATVTVESGKAVFTQNCSMCHQVKGQGGLVGPQLDGIGNWGQKALTEKVLDPNRNISEAFRNYNIVLKSGKTLTGLYSREEGEVLVFANPGGEEFPVPKNQIAKRTASSYTLMPDHFSKTIAKKDFDALLKYLLNLKE